MKGKTLKYSVSVAVLATMMSATPTFASPLSPTITQSQIQLTQGKINDLQTKIQQLDNQIIIGMDKSQKINDSIKAQLQKIEQAKVNIDKAQNDLDAHKKVYSERLQSIQLQGQTPIVTYAELLLSSNNISEFLTRSTAISQILQSDSDLMNSLNQKEQALKNAEQELHNQLDSLKQSQNELAAEQSKIASAKQEVEKELADSKNSLQQQQNTMAQQQSQVALQRAQQQAPAINSTSVSNLTANTSNSGTAGQVIATAERYLGVPYVWGGTSPSGFDCSGLMQYVFHSVGVNLPRVASAQQNVGTRISPDQVQPGDLVFQGDPAYHVGLYIGNGEWIQAPETGDVVKISQYNPSSFSSAARVLQ